MNRGARRRVGAGGGRTVYAEYHVDEGQVAVRPEKEGTERPWLHPDVVYLRRREGGCGQHVGVRVAAGWVPRRRGW